MTILQIPDYGTDSGDFADYKELNMSNTFKVTRFRGTATNFIVGAIRVENARDHIIRHVETDGIEGPFGTVTLTLEPL